MSMSVRKRKRERTVNEMRKNARESVTERESKAV